MSTVEEMQNVDIRTVDKESLVDLNDVVIDESLSAEDRAKQFVAQIRNPYVYRIGDVVVKNVYSTDGVSLKERFEQFARSSPFPRKLALCHGFW